MSTTIYFAFLSPCAASFSVRAVFVFVSVRSCDPCRAFFTLSVGWVGGEDSRWGRARERERWKREAGDACREHRRVCEVVTFPAWHQELPAQAGQALFPRAGFFNWFFSLGAPPLFQSSLLLRSPTPLRLVLANKGDYRRVLTGSAPPIIVHYRQELQWCVLISW